MHHSAVGDLELRHEALIILQAEPDSPSADALTLLGSISAPALPQQQCPGIDN